MGLPDTHMLKSEAAKLLGCTLFEVWQHASAGRLFEEKVLDSTGRMVPAVTRESVETFKAAHL